MTRRCAAIVAAAALLAGLGAGAGGDADAPPPQVDPGIEALIGEVSTGRIEADVRALVGFGTRHTLSETESDARGIGAARRWIEAEFRAIARACGGCLDVVVQSSVVEPGETDRIPVATEIVNVLAVLRGSEEPNRWFVMSGDIDSRVSDPLDATSDSPGANDNASGMAGAIEAARVLSRRRYPATIVLAGLSGEEQGLFGGRHMARDARRRGIGIEAVLNNDMIGNIEGVDGVIENSTFRVFSEPVPVTESDAERRRRRSTGGEVDGPSRQLARYVDRIAELYFPVLDAKMIYRLDRFGRGGHHRPFNDEGFPAVRIMETHENYRRQHQDIRVEAGIRYGDTIDGVNFDYARRLTGVNVATLASLALAPPPPSNVTIAGAVEPAAQLAWDPVEAERLAGYKVYWRETTAPQWTNWRWVGRATAARMDSLVIDNYLFGVASVARDGNESVVVFPVPARRR